MKKCLNIIFSRLFFVGLAIVLQFGWVFLLFYHASVKFSYVNILVRILSVIVSLTVINNWSNPYYKLSWIFIILLVPLLGITLYLIFGRSKITKKTLKKMDEVHQDVSPYLMGTEGAREALEKMDAGVARQSNYIFNWAQYPLFSNTDTRYYKSGEEMFDAMLEAMQQAKQFIFMEYFILEEGVMLNQMLDILEDKVKEGVVVRVIYDDVGSIQTLPSNFLKKMETRNIPCEVFNPFLPVMSVVLNNRDHRKILVVDGEIGFTGGINIADEYINQKVKYGYWKDAGVRLQGEGVWSLSCMFLEMWNYIRHTTEDYTKFQVKHEAKETTELRCGFVQPYSDTPLDRENVGENVYLNMISHAKDYIYIFTPYLIIDHEMIVALTNAAKCGVDVRIVTPGVPDKRLVFLLTQSYYQQLIEGGVKIYEYTPGFIHAKCFVADDKVATVGTINLDYRSLYLHFECGVFLYNTNAVFELKEDAVDTIAKSREITLEFCQQRSVWITAIQSMLRVISPLL